MQTDIVIIGGGPVGCWTAIQAKKHNPDVNIRIYERYPEYQRDHMMSIKRETFQSSGLFASQEDKELFTEIATAHSREGTKIPKRKLPKVTNIRTLDLERILKAHCEKLGIGFTYAKIESPQNAMKRNPECQLFVAADGARSDMRTALLGEESTDEKDVLYSVDVKYRAKGQAKHTRTPTYNKIDMIVVENVGHEKDGETEVALRFLLDKATYDSIPEATFKKPLKLSGSYTVQDGGTQLGHFQQNEVGAFENEIRKFQNIREKHANENRIHASERVTKVKLSQYASKKFAVTVDEDNKHKAGWFFVGDAAMGVPFYRSINAGLKLGSQLGPLLADPDKSSELKTQIYEAKRENTLKHEFGIVARKLRGINTYRNHIRPLLQTTKKAGTIAGFSVAAVIAIPLIPIAFLGIGAARMLGIEVRLM